MVINPYASPQYGVPSYTKKQEIFQTVRSHYVLLNIVKHLKSYQFKDIQTRHGSPICINNEFFIARKKTKFRMISRLDWVHYTPKELAHAIQTNTVEAYYVQQLLSPKSDPNDWKDPIEEFDLKTYYAERVGRTLDSMDNI